MAIIPIIAKFDLSSIPDIISKANKRFANNEARSFRRTTNNWDNKPKFMVVPRSVGFGVTEYDVFTIDKRYMWINYGTDPHVIEPKNEGYALRFQEGYSPKTTPNIIVSKGTGVRSGEVVYRKSVIQSIEPRNFTGAIKKRASKRWSNALKTEFKIFLSKRKQ